MRVLLCILLLVASALPAWAEKRVALVIGNSAYTDAPALKNPTSDATEVAAALRRLDFDVIDGTDLDIGTMRARIREFSRRIEGADLALFFYAGHGVQVAGQNYLLPTDAVVERESDLDFSTVNVDLVIRQMERAAKTKIVLLDSCRDNPFETALTRSMGATRSSKALSRGLAPIRAEGGALIGFATDPGDVAYDGEGKHSPFTQALLNHIETPGLEINVMMTRVRADVFKDTNRKQRPWTTSSLIGEVYLKIDNVENVTVTAPAGQADLELAFWSAIANSGDPADFEAYIQQFPEGTFVPLARNRLAALAPEVQPKPDPLAGSEATNAPKELTSSQPSEDSAAAGQSSDSAQHAAAPSLTEPGTPSGQPAQLPPQDTEPEQKLATAIIPKARPERETPAAPAVNPPQIYKDCEVCPAMVAIPGGTFLMGSNDGEAAERPVTEVTIAPFMMAVNEVSMDEFSFVLEIDHQPEQNCYAWTKAGKMRNSSDTNWYNAHNDWWESWESHPRYKADPETDMRPIPAVCINWDDAAAYVDWLNTQVEGTPYRLPSEAEFEYAMRAGSTGAYPWGNEAAEACKWANAADATSRFKWRNRWCDDSTPDIALSGSYPPNAFGLHDMVGNLWEWTADCWNGSHKGAAPDGSARTTGNCKSRVLRGGSWDDPVKNLRSAYRVGIPADRRQINVGFRVVRDPVQ